NTVVPTTGGMSYDINDANVGSLAGTTAGTVTWSYPAFKTAKKDLIFNLNAYENTTGTAQAIMQPAGITGFGSVVTLSGTCTGATLGTGANTGCTALAVPYPCCTGNPTGSCNTLQFLTLPSSMGGTQT